MIKQRLIVQEDGSRLIETFSDSWFKIRQDETGNIYDAAVDPEQYVRTYTETDEPIEQDEDPQKILDILLGGNS